MKKSIVLALIMLVTLAQAEMKCEAGKCGMAMKSQRVMMVKPFQSVDEANATILQKGVAKEYCHECGMTLHKFYKTNHSATTDGKVKQYCSIHCLANDINKGSKVDNIKVVDVTSLKFVDVDKVFYVVGSGKKGTMSLLSKYAFVSKDDANAFAKAYGGRVMPYKDALKTAKCDF